MSLPPYPIFDPCNTGTTRATLSQILMPPTLLGTASSAHLIPSDLSKRPSTADISAEVPLTDLVSPDPASQSFYSITHGNSQSLLICQPFPKPVTVSSTVSNFPPHPITSALHCWGENMVKLPHSQHPLQSIALDILGPDEDLTGNETPPNRRFSSTTGGYGGPRMQYPRHVETHHYTRPNHSRHPTAPISNDPASEYSMYPNNTYRESPDTVYTRESNGSQSTEPWTNSTDPSSENSSVDRTQYAQKVDHDAYGAAYSHRSPRHGAIHEYHEHEQYAPSEDPPFSHPSHIPTQQQYSYNQNGKGSMGPPPVPMHAAGAPAQIRQGNSMLNGPTAPSEATGMPKLQKIPSEGKRKSWLKRRFSKG